MIVQFIIVFFNGYLIGIIRGMKFLARKIEVSERTEDSVYYDEASLGLLAMSIFAQGLLWLGGFYE